ncbi:carbohydrate sulfotransferase 11-like [Lytechinus variegatus]|uniref:carbohydrate sulfotransferase 11-like n=1 Tax=Lytechinus variegatus TaxID=7654 RepID=UPI001BB2901A|nr:carbohydrate sulfotransferase 11-like [Lytechinus variegatus]XP_041465143.1 carbohydrate sulfotransferase 11-like [Lytechinus variegatus]XP_041465144.1 carbohydrate sulfotransferase 11-like [Lytechinus variegatus]XP_041465145.1 carbohydrate sulfotransferase 11-like [Lytechinus variegatus]
MKPVVKETVVSIPLPDDMAPSLRSAFVTRILILLIFIFSVSSLFYTTMQLHYPRSKTATSITRPGSLQLAQSSLDVEQLDITNRKQSVHNLTHQLHQVQSRHNSSVHEARSRKIPRKNITFVLPRSFLNQNRTKLHNAGDDSPRTLEEDHLILVEPRRLKLSREKAMKRRELMALKTRTWDQIQAARKQAVERMCDQRPDLRNGTLERIINANRTQLSHYLVSDRLEIIFLAVPMAASDFWKDAFKQLSFPGSQRGSGAAEENNWRVLSSYDETEIRQRLREYKKLLFVRDPFARIVSAYRRKFLSPSAYSKQYEAIIEETYRKWNTGVHYNRSSNISFQEFAYFVEDAPDDIFSSLWQPTSKLAMPCEIKYNFIGKLEEGPPEFTNMLKSARMHSLVKYEPHSNTPSPKGSIYDHYFLQLWTNQIKRLYKKYEDDFLMFGYSLPTYMHPWVFGRFNVTRH